MVIPMLRNPIWVRLQRGALQRARERGYVVMIMEEPTDDPRPPDDYRYLVEESRVDGLLLATALRVPEHGRGVCTPSRTSTSTAGARTAGNDVVMDEAGAIEAVRRPRGRAAATEPRADRRPAGGGYGASAGSVPPGGSARPAGSG